MAVQRPLAAIVLAAGEGTRMRSTTPKVLHPLLGRPMLAYVLDAAVEATGQRPVVVYSPATVAVRPRMSSRVLALLLIIPRCLRV